MRKGVGDSGQSTRLNCEIVVFSGAFDLGAQDLGAKRVELNAPGSYEAGGTLIINCTPDGRSLQGILAPRCCHTPVKGLTSIASELEIALRIMIPPHGPRTIGNWWRDCLRITLKVFASSRTPKLTAKASVAGALSCQN